MNVDKMRRYAERSREDAARAEAARERADWLAAMTPEHRARHEGRSQLLCGECFEASSKAAGDVIRRSFARMQAQREASR